MKFLAIPGSLRPASVTLPLPSASIGEEQLMTTPEIAFSLKGVLAAIEQAMNQAPEFNLADNVRLIQRVSDR